MSFTNFDTREINCKVIYFGPEGAGKATNFRSIYSATSADVQSGLLEFGAREGEPRYFSFLPISMGHVKDFHLKLHLFALPPGDVYETVHSVILNGIDGYVFVADSRVEMMAENIGGLLKAKRLMSENNIDPAGLPAAFQYNKRDVDDAVPVEVFRQELNSVGHPDQEAIAKDSVGTMETLQLVAKQIIRRLAP